MMHLNILIMNDIDRFKLADYYIDDLKNIREELNWRVKIAYTSNMTVFPGLAGLASFLLSRELDVNLIYIIACTISLLLSMYVNLQVFNRLIEKKIEMYILDIQKLLKEKYNLKCHSWISYLYGMPSRFSIVGYLSLFYQYIFPNIISSVILFAPSLKSYFWDLNGYLIALFATALILNIFSYVIIFIFIVFFKNVRIEHYKFYKKIS